MSGISRVMVAAALAGSFVVAGGAFATTPQSCPQGSHGIVIGFPDPQNPYYICAQDPRIG